MHKDLSFKKWVVFTSSLLISLVLGVLYTWSVLKGAIEESLNKGTGEFNWELSSINDPYSVAIISFAFVMMISGKAYDKFGPRLTSLIGAGLITSGLLITASSTSYLPWVIGFGVLVGSGIGFGYAVITPTTIRWFPPEKTGLITGLVVSGFGLAPVFIAPLFSGLIKAESLSYALYFYAVLFAVVAGICSLLLFNPPETSSKSNKNHFTEKDNIKVSEILRKPEFYILWILYFIGSGAGLMVIGFATDMVKKGLGKEAFLGAAIIAIGNSAGRVAAGYFSDKIGRLRTLQIMFGFQLILMAVSGIYAENSTSVVLLLIITTFIGLNYGSNLSLFPAITKDLWGLRNFGINYGVLFTAWGAGGFVMSRVSQMIKAVTGSLEYSFWMAAALLAAGSIVLVFFEKIMKHKH